MANDYFRFRQFEIQQSRCAMKVCTDACLFGAWTAVKKTSKKVLDIGTGTGLLSLMYAQQHPEAQISCIEIDKDAALQAQENFDRSPWKNNFHLHHAALQSWQMHDQFDLIFSNPPFFENDLHSADDRRNQALHSTALTLEELLEFVHGHLEENGQFAVLLPYHRTEYFEKKAGASGLFVRDKIFVRQTERHAYFRSMLLLQKENVLANISEIAIRNAQNGYSPAFAALLRDYYLFL